MESLHEMQIVDLYAADIGDDGVKTLSNALEENTTVTEINLGWNGIGDEGVSALAKALEENSTVTRIDLWSNEIGAEGVAALADALKVNTSVTAIRLDENHGIGSEGATALADALKVNKTLTSIYIRHSGIDDKGVAALADALKVNTLVTTINISDDRIDALIARNKRFRCLFLFDARQMLLSLMCADECSVVWPYLLENGDTDGIVAPDNAETIRAEFLGVVVGGASSSLASVDAS
jgi:hypothetical protein